MDIRELSGTPLVPCIWLMLLVELGLDTVGRVAGTAKIRRKSMHQEAECSTSYHELWSLLDHGRSRCNTECSLQKWLAR